MKDKKERSIILALAFSAVIWAVGVYYLPAEYKNIAFALTFVIAGFDLITYGYEKLLEGDIFNRAFIVTVAGVIIFLIGKPAPGAVVMWLHQLDELFAELMMKKAKENLPRYSDEKGPLHNTVKKLSAVFTPVMVAIAVLTAVIYPSVTGDSFKHALYIAAIILIISCAETVEKCTRLCFRTGLRILGHMGVTVNSSREIEKLANAENLAIINKDLLTTGKMNVDRIITDLKEEEFLKKACSLTALAPSALGDALLERYGRDSELNIIRGFKEEEDRGVCGYIGPKEFFLGSSEYLAEQGINVDDVPAEAALHLAGKNGYLGSVVFADEPVEGTKEELKKLRDMGLKKISVITSDNRGNSEKFTENTGIDETVEECTDTENTLLFSDSEVFPNAITTDSLAHIAEIRKAALSVMSRIKMILTVFAVGEIILLMLALLGMIPCFVADIGVIVSTVTMLMIAIRE